MSSPESPWTEEETAAIRARLLAFFDEHRRPLPWRAEPSPYGILVSEIMSQQTRLDAVVPYYRRWMERFPDTAALAEAETEEVLSLWQGLGYYRRARNLHRAARELQARYEGEVPSDPEELRSLPGVGSYTAGAVASMAFGVPAPAVDGNVRRVMARLRDEPRPTPARLQRWAGALVDPERPGDFNQALMELGSLVCTPRSPDCTACPVAEFCRARAAGTAEDRPAPRERTRVPHRHEGVLVLAQHDELPGSWNLLLRRRPSGGLLGGMWEFPGTEVAREEDAEAGATHLLKSAARSSVGGGRSGRRDRSGGERDAGDAVVGFDLVRLPTIAHTFSHLKVSYHPFLGMTEGDVGGARARHGVERTADAEAGASRPEEDVRWVGGDEIGTLPLPAAQRRIVAAAEGLLAELSPRG